MQTKLPEKEGRVRDLPAATREEICEVIAQPQDST